MKYEWLQNADAWRFWYLVFSFTPIVIYQLCKAGFVLTNSKFESKQKKIAPKISFTLHLFTEAMKMDGMEAENVCNARFKVTRMIWSLVQTAYSKPTVIAINNWFVHWFRVVFSSFWLFVLILHLCFASTIEDRNFREIRKYVWVWARCFAIRFCLVYTRYPYKSKMIRFLRSASH